MPPNPLGNGSNVVLQVEPPSMDLYIPMFGEPVLRSTATTTITEGFNQFTAMFGSNWSEELGEMFMLLDTSDNPYACYNLIVDLRFSPYVCDNETSKTTTRKTCINLIKDRTIRCP